MDNVTVQRLGKVQPGVEGDRGKTIDPVPIVLWSKANPSAVFYYQLEPGEDTDNYKTFQKIEPLCGSGFRSISYQGSLPKDSENEDKMDLVNSTIAADINGDGMDELILVRSHGGVEVFGAGKKLFEFSSPSHDPNVAIYQPIYSYVARLKNRDVVYLLFDQKVMMKDKAKDEEQSILAKHGLNDSYVIVQIDQYGARRIVLGDVGWKTRYVNSLGAINLPGSDGIDELVVVEVQNYGDDAYLTRYRTDGAPIDQPRKIYVPFSFASISRFEFLPQSEKAVTVDSSNNLYFVAPRKPANWIRHVELKNFGSEKNIWFLQTTDIQSDPKALVFVDNEIYAINEEGKTFTFDKGAWVESKEPRPLYQIKLISPLDELSGVLPSVMNRDQFLVIQSHKRQPRKVSREELLSSAEKFMLKIDLDMVKDDAVPSLEKDRSWRDAQIEEERIKLGLPDKPTSVEDWKTRFPESYKKVKERLEHDFYVDLSSELFRPVVDWPKLDISKVRKEYRNPDEYLEWLKTITVDAETSFTLVTRNAPTATFQVKGYFQEANTMLSEPSIVYRATGSEISIVTVLQGGDKPDTKEPGFYLIQHQ